MYNIYLFIYLSMYISIYLSVNVYIYLSICQCIYLFLYLLIYIYVYIFIYLSRMNAQATYFDDALALAGVINGLNYEGFCEAAAKEQPDDVDLDECRQGMIQYIPRYKI